LAIGRSGSLFDTIRTLIRARQSGINLRVPVTVDQQRLRTTLASLAQEVDRPSRDARVRVIGGRLRIEAEQVGRDLDIDASVKKAVPVLSDLRAKRIELVVRPIYPRVRADDLRHLDCVLSEFSTPFNPSQSNRTHNLRLAAAAINETVIMPGEQFSLNAALGPRITDRGYKDAPTYVNGRSVPTPGGGVCQVATTLYNAALLAGLKITERHHHSRPVPYCPAGRDATVSYGSLDLKLVNNLKHPILLLCWTEGNRLHVSFVGSCEDDTDVELVRSNLATVQRPVKEVPDPTLPPGKRVVEEKGSDGHRVTLTRIISRNGQVLRREVLHTDVYQPWPKIVRVGPPTPANVPSLSSDGQADRPAGAIQPSHPASRPAKPPSARAAPRDTGD
ncbi:MAG: VanW family protein, partial [Armatimonadetes bacterium]|nr:VanW family protein [Armatimonadota bacterium]